MGALEFWFRVADTVNWTSKVDGEMEWLKCDNVGWLACAAFALRKQKRTMKIEKVDWSANDAQVLIIFDMKEMSEGMREQMSFYAVSHAKSKKKEKFLFFF